MAEAERPPWRWSCSPRSCSSTASGPSHDSTLGAPRPNVVGLRL